MNITPQHAYEVLAFAEAARNLGSSFPAEIRILGSRPDEEFRFTVTKIPTGRVEIRIPQNGAPDLFPSEEMLRDAIRQPRRAGVF